jgi:hypothetical protein
MRTPFAPIRSSLPRFFTTTSPFLRKPLPGATINKSASKLATRSSISPNKPALKSSPLKTSSLKSTRSPPPSTPQLPAYQSFTAKLAGLPTRTPLYLAPSHSLYIFASYFGAAFCLSYAGFNYLSQVAHPPPDLASWIPIAFGGICFLMAAFGGWLLMAPARLIKSITAVPAALSTAPKVAGPGRSAVAAKTVGAAAAQPSLNIEVELRRMFPLPFFPARVITTTPNCLGLNAPIYYPPTTPLTSAQRLALQKQQEAAQAAEREKSILLAPFRHLSQASYRLFKAISRSWTREGFLKLEVKGHGAYKLDITGGWALDEGRALDRICKVQRS